FRPWGLCGKPLSLSRHMGAPDQPLRPAGMRAGGLAAIVVLAVAALPMLVDYLPYAAVLAQDVLVAVVFAVSLHVMMGLGGMPSFGHAAYFGLGAYAAAMLFTMSGIGMLGAIVAGPLVAGAAAMMFGWLGASLIGVYLAMLTLAFAQIIWSIVFQWDDVTGGSNGIFGVWPDDWLSGNAFYYFTLVIAMVVVLGVRRLAFSPFGMALRSTRDSALRADAIGLNVRHIQWMAFIVAGLLAGLAGALYAFAKGGTSPEVMTVGKSVDALV